MGKNSLPEESKKRLLLLLEEAVRKRAPKEEFGLLFSGGIDSALLALLFKRLNLSFRCFFGYVEGLGKPKDLDSAKKVAKNLHLKLETVSTTMKDIPYLVSQVIPIIGSTSPVQVSVALPIALACRKARKAGLKTVFSGMGADELFAGYAKFRDAADIVEQSIELLEQLPGKDLQRDLAISSKNGLSLKIPFLDPEVVKFALSLGKEFKLSKKQNKLILRQIAKDLGLSSKIAERKKLAAQYGSNFDKALEKLAKKAKAKGKQDYLNSLASKPVPASRPRPASKPEPVSGPEPVQKPVPVSGPEPASKPEPISRPKPGQNPGLVALSSGGKDSCLALWLMQKQGFKVKCLASIIPTNPDSYMYHQPNLEVLMLQSKALEIPLIIERTDGKKEEELDALEMVLLEARRKYDVAGVVSGALFSNYQRQRIQKICDSLNLKLYSPLWHKDQVEELQQLVKSGFVFVVSKVAGLKGDWLGKRIGKKEIAELTKLSKKKGFNAAGEGGEFESIVLDGPNFKKRIKISMFRKNMQNDITGSLEIEDAELEDK